MKPGYDAKEKERKIKQAEDLVKKMTEFSCFDPWIECKECPMHYGNCQCLVAEAEEAEKLNEKIRIEKLDKSY